MGVEANNASSCDSAAKVKGTLCADATGGQESIPTKPKESVPEEEQLLDDVQKDAVEFRSYKMRWYILAVVSILNLSNAASWICYSPVANYTDEFYGSNSANLLSMVFLIIAIPVAFIAMWCEQRFGLRLAILLAANSNGIGAAVRLCSSFMPEGYRFAVVMIGQGIAACAYPFIMFLPTKVSSSWFPANQRTIANTLSTLSNPIGVMLANVISPLVVVHVRNIVWLNILVAIPSFIACAMAVLGVRVSAPPVPPSISAGTATMGFLQGLKRAMRSRAFLLLFMALGGGIGMFNALYTVMQQVLCPKGYSNQFSGLCCALMIIGGLFGATISGIIVDRTKKFEEVMKIAFGFAVIFGILLVEAALWPNVHVLIAFASFAFGFCGLAGYPVGLELGAECTFPVAQTTSAGLIVLCGQLQAIVYIILIKALAQPMRPSDADIQVCTVHDPEGDETAVKAHDMARPLLVFVGIGTAVICLFIILFKPKYRRLRLEKGNELKVMVAKDSEKAPKDSCKVVSA